MLWAKEESVAKKKIGNLSTRNIWDKKNEVEWMHQVRSGTNPEKREGKISEKALGCRRI